MRAHNFIDVTGQTFGSLKVLHLSTELIGGKICWTCLCVCGKERTVESYALRSGKTKTCGHPVLFCKHGHEFTPENTYVAADGHRTCITCRRKAAADNIDVHNKWVNKNPERTSRYSQKYVIKKKYNMTVEEYYNKLNLQNSMCALCGLPFTGKPHLDHNHDTGKLRDFVHRECNMALGLFKDDPNICRLAAEYLEKHKEI